MRFLGEVTWSAVWNWPTKSSILKCSWAVTMSCRHLVTLQPVFWSRFQHKFERSCCRNSGMVHIDGLQSS